MYLPQTSLITALSVPRFALAPSQTKAYALLMPDSAHVQTVCHHIPDLQTIRKAAGITPAQFAAAISCSTDMIHKIEQGSARPSTMTRHHAWLVYLLYLGPNRMTGWKMASIAAPPTGPILHHSRQEHAQAMADCRELAADSVLELGAFKDTD